MIYLILALCIPAIIVITWLSKRNEAKEYDSYQTQSSDSGLFDWITECDCDHCDQ